MAQAKRRANGKGTIRQLPSGRYQAKARNPQTEVYVPAPMTFDTRLDASRWLADYAHGLDDVDLSPIPTMTIPTFGEYATEWLANGGRRGGLKPRTHELYTSLLKRYILPTFKDRKLTRISPQDVRGWYAALDKSKTVSNRQAYGLLASIMNTAKRDRIISDTPCTIDGAHKRGRTSGVTKIATVEELTAIANAVPDRYKAAVWLSSWCCLRQGELLELRRKDLNLLDGVVTITRGVTYVEGEFVVSTPKSAAGIRVVDIPPHIIDDLRHHLETHVDDDPEALLYPAADGGHMRSSTLYKVFYPARETAGRPDLRWHDLRHTGATYFGQMGATLAEIMSRVGHADIKTTMIYQHATQTRTRALSDALSTMVVDMPDNTDNVVTLTHKRTAS
jgi:integrase